MVMIATTEQTAELRVTEENLGLTVYVPGDITVRNAAETSAAVVEAWEQKARPRRLVLDMSNVQHLDSSGVGALMEIRQRVGQANSRLVLRGLQEIPRRLLERTGIVRLFDIRNESGGSDILGLAEHHDRSRVIEAMPPRRARRALWALVWLCVVGAALAGIGVAAYPTMQRYHAQLEQIPVLGGLMGAMDQRVSAMEQSMKDQFGAIETKLTSHIRTERRQQAAAAKQAAEMRSRLNEVEAQQRATDARISDLEQKLEQNSNTNKENNER
jgi:anti-anti-sigma factor